MKQVICRYAEEGKESNAGGAHDNPQPRQQESEAAGKKASDPGSVANASGMSGDLDGGGGIGRGTQKDPHLDKGDPGPSPDKIDLGE